MDCPTDAQLKFIARLGYSGPPPQSKSEASLVIDACKAGADSREIESQLAGHRRAVTKGWLAEQRQYRKDSFQQAKDSAGAIAGFMFDASCSCPRMVRYAGAFLPVQVARKWPDLLPPAKECAAKDCDCSCRFEDVMEDERLPRKTRMIVRPGKFVPVGHRPGRRLAWLVLIVAAIVIYVKYLR